MIYDHIGGIRDPLKQDLALEFCRNQNKVISILTETHTNHDQIHHIRNDWLGSNFFCLGDSLTKGRLSCFHWNLKVDTDPKERFVSFNDKVLCVYASSEYSTREQLHRGRFFEGLQNYMENKNKGNENKIIIEDFNCTMDKMDSDGKNKTQRLYWCCSSYALSKLIVDNGLEDLENNSLLCKPEFFSATKTSFFIKNTKKQPLLSK